MASVLAPGTVTKLHEAAAVRGKTVAVEMNLLLVSLQ
jgi:hypothetical protein